MGHSARTSLRRIGVGRNLLIWLAALVVGLLAIGAGAALSGSRAASAQSADFDATVSVKHAVIPVIAGDTLTVEARFRNISRADGPHDGEATFDLTIVVEPPSGSATRYSWDNEEFSLAEVRDFSKQHTFGQTGTYTVRAEIYDIDGQQSGWSAANRFDSDSETFTAYDPVTVQFSASEYTVDEDGGEVHITLTMSGSLPVEVGVRFSTLDYTALSRTDFSHTILLMRFASNSTRLTVPVRISDDYTVEPEETFQVKLEPTNSNPSYVTVSSSPATVTIRDNDEATVQFPTDQIRVNEDSGQVSVRVEVSSGGGRCAVASSFEVNISYSDPSGGLAPGETGPSSLTFDRCDRVRAFLADVANVTGDADVVFTLDSVTAADSGVASRIEIGDTSSVTVTVIDTDRLYVGRVSPTSGAATLNAGDSQTFTAIAARPGNNRASYEWTVDGQQVDSGTTSFTNEVQNSYTHTFPSTGTYNVRVEFTDSTGMTAFTSWTVEVVDSTMPTNRAPSVSRVSPSSSSITLTTGSSRDVHGARHGRRQQHHRIRVDSERQWSGQLGHPHGHRRCAEVAHALIPEHRCVYGEGGVHRRRRGHRFDVLAGRGRGAAASPTDHREQCTDSQQGVAGYEHDLPDQGRRADLQGEGNRLRRQPDEVEVGRRQAQQSLRQPPRARADVRPHHQHDDDLRTHVP